VPITDIAAGIIRSLRRRWRHDEAERLGGSEVDDQFELGGLVLRNRYSILSVLRVLRSAAGLRDDRP
jgi:hypothetical protein